MLDDHTTAARDGTKTLQQEPEGQGPDDTLFRIIVRQQPTLSIIAESTTLSKVPQGMISDATNEIQTLAS